MYSEFSTLCVFFFFNDTATTEIYTLSLHDALPICQAQQRQPGEHHRRRDVGGAGRRVRRAEHHAEDRKSTRLNSSHANISYAVFCLKKKTSTVTRVSFTPTRTARNTESHVNCATHI